MNHSGVVSILAAVFLATACGGTTPDEDLDLSARDPRCVPVCPVTMPRYEGVGEVCNAASRVQCFDECEARIAGLPTICQSCLLEESCFDPGSCYGDSTGGSCNQTTCTITSDLGTCTYPTEDMAARLKCFKQVNPRREASCDVDWRPTTECAQLCG